MPADKDYDDAASDKKQSKSSSSNAGSGSKSAKDLSHVPCKFYKVGSCTAGSSCPFSHSAEPGAPKDVCAWFIKGNCKFGHKCALAHILPGQPMSMDRKNKKAAQLANNSGSGSATSERPSGRDRSERGKSNRKEVGRGDASSRGSSLLTGGSTAPTRLLARGPAALSKASLTSPSAPAPPITVKGTDFVQALVDGLPEGKDSSKDTPATKDATFEENSPISPDAAALATPKLEPSKPKAVQSPTQNVAASPQSPETIAIPPGLQSNASHQPTSPSRLNGGFSPGTSPSTNNPLGNGVLSTSPFSAPSHQASFISSTYAGENSFLSSRPPNAAPSSSLGAGKWGEVDPGSPPRPGHHYTSINAEYDSTYGVSSQQSGIDEDEGGEDFVPSSLTELLTPEEKARRLTRGASQQQGGGRDSEGEDAVIRGLAGVNLNSSASGPAGIGGGHRYSRSVPSPSFLGDIRSNIWSADTNISSSPSQQGFNSTAGLPTSPGRLGFANGGYSSIGMGSAGGPNGIPDSAGLSSAGSAASFNAHLSPSNASAAFLSSGLHQQYAKSRQTNTSGVGRSLFGGGTRPPGLDFSTSTSAAGNNGFSNSPTSRQLGGGIQTSSGDFFPPHRPGLPSNRSSSGNRPHDAGGTGLGDGGLMSPGSRALQSHAPGQSLPQGLAAGYSRIHALPPPLPLNSPGASRGLSGTPGSYIPGSSPLSSSYTSGNGEWRPSSLTQSSQFGEPGTTPSKQHPTNAIDQMFSKLSYSQATKGPVQPGVTNTGGVSPFMPPQVSRSASGRGGPAGVGSPLAATQSAGDDDLFSMDDS